MARQLKGSTVLKRAKAIIEDPGNWTQGEYRRGKRCCALGAIRMVTGRENDMSDENEQLDACASDLFGMGSIHYVNDGAVLTESGMSKGVSRKTAHKNVLAAFDCAIAKLTEAEKAQRAAAKVA